MRLRSPASPLRPPSLAPAAAVALACLAAGPANAAPGDEFDLVAGASLRHDDNLFRLPDGQRPATASGERGEQTFAAYAGLRLDKPYSLQRFQLSATATLYRHRNYSQLDFTAREYAAAWLWAMTPRLTGILAAERNERLTNFADFRSVTGDNKQVNETRRAHADWWATGGWHLVGGAATIDSKNEAGFTAVGSSRQDTAEAGLRYASSAANSIAVVRREGRGEFQDRVLDTGPASPQLDTAYDTAESEVRLLWRASGKSHIDARLAYVEREHDHFPARDFSGGVGRLVYTWTPTGKLQVRAEALRDLVSFQEAQNSYYLLHSATLQPIWQAGAKTALRLRFDLARRDYRGAIVPVATQREDTIYGAQAGIDWRPTAAVLFDAYFGREKRTSNLSGAGYDAYMTGLTVELRF